jgi:hypothetical protein
MHSIFERNFTVYTRLDHENSVLRDIVKSEIQAPSILLRNVESLALKIHEQYIHTATTFFEEKKANGEVTPEDQKDFEEKTRPFEELSSHLKLANIRQARSIPIKLNIIGCELANPSDKRDAIVEFSQDEIIDLAMYEHDEWCEEKIGQGWTYGEVRDDSRLIHDCLVPWDDLTPEVQQYDIDPVKNIPNLVDSIGLKIVRSKIRMLTIEMHKFYQSNEKDTKDFEDLPDYIKYSNYKQADFLVKILKEQGYDVVDSDMPGDAIESIDEDSIEYLAEREHAAWCKLKLNVGWKYGPVRDEESKINPNLMDWEDLDVNTKNNNKRTFRNLPQLCKNVDLKIVKN